ncbi:MAG: nucleotide-binding protein [Acidobacteriota bacterium]
MNTIEENAYHLLETMVNASPDEWQGKGGLNPLGIYTKRLQELSGLSSDDINVGLSWLLNKQAIRVTEEINPNSPFNYRWVNEITSQGKLLHRQYKESLAMKPENAESVVQPAIASNPQKVSVVHVGTLPDLWRDVTIASDPRKVFVVHGRNSKARDALFQFLRSIGLHPIEWSEAIDATGEATPYIGTVLEIAFTQAQAVVVLMTPDDEACLREHFRKPDDEHYEKALTPQARPNVLFEAGMAMGRNPTRTVIVELGKLRPFSNIVGHHAVRLNDTTQARQQLANRLKKAGCSVNLTGLDWHTEGHFDEAIQYIGNEVS